VEGIAALAAAPFAVTGIAIARPRGAVHRPSLPVLLLVTIAGLVAAACATTTTTTPRPATWARPIASPTTANWHQVAAELHRCAQPSATGMRELAAAGIRSVVNLREYHSDTDEVAGTGLALVELPFAAGGLTYAQLCQALRAVLLADKPVLVHCRHGADRTGAVCAAYRVAVEGWTPQAALAEMTGGDFGHSVWFPNLRTLVAELDRAQLRADVGLPPAR
jgi:protein tyrosine phosphatase (PTP) superfamily phosphohydrolase (DUF442 family)